jgi:hypothetical protein
MLQRYLQFFSPCKSCPLISAAYVPMPSVDRGSEQFSEYGGGLTGFHQCNMQIYTIFFPEGQLS